MKGLKADAQRAQFWRLGLVGALEKMGAADEARVVRERDLLLAEWWAQCQDGAAMLTVAFGAGAPPQLVLEALYRTMTKTTQRGQMAMDYVRRLLGGEAPDPRTVYKLRVVVAHELIGKHPEAKRHTSQQHGISAVSVDTHDEAELSAAAALVLMQATLEAGLMDLCKNPRCTANHQEGYVLAASAALATLSQVEDRDAMHRRVADSLRQHVPAETMVHHLQRPRGVN